MRELGPPEEVCEFSPEVRERSVRMVLEHQGEYESQCGQRCAHGPDHRRTWVAWFNHHRLLEPIGNIPHAEAEANYHRQLVESAVPV